MGAEWFSLGLTAGIVLGFLTSWAASWSARRRVRQAWRRRWAASRGAPMIVLNDTGGKWWLPADTPPDTVAEVARRLRDMERPATIDDGGR